MNRRDIVIGLIILAVVAGIIYWVRRPKPELEIPESTVEETIEESFKIDIPDDVEKAELKDIAGKIATGIATRKFIDGKFTHTALVDLPDPAEGYFYEGWLAKEDGELVSTGKLRVAKGGYLLEFSSDVDYSDYSGVVITLESKDDGKPEEHVLEGSF
ncbi:anti-sigma factor [Patescibacteria group bacterium]